MILYTTVYKLTNGYMYKSILRPFGKMHRHMYLLMAENLRAHSI